MVEEQKHIRIDFSGGFWPDLRLDSRSLVDQEAELARAYYRWNRQGLLTGFLDRLSATAVKLLRLQGWSNEQLIVSGFDGQHSYRLVEYQETENDVLLRFQFVKRT